MTERELERRALRKLAVLRHVEEVCRTTWRRPAATTASAGSATTAGSAATQADGLDGLKDRSSRPHHSPRVTQADLPHSPCSTMQT